MQRKYPKQFRMYLKDDEVLIWEKLSKIAETEARPVAEIVRTQIHEYVRLHEPGNPQQRLDTIAQIGHAYRANSCCICSKPAEVQAFTRKGLNLLYCRECYDENGRRQAEGYRELPRTRSLSPHDI